MDCTERDGKEDNYNKEKTEDKQSCKVISARIQWESLLFTERL